MSQIVNFNTGAEGVVRGVVQADHDGFLDIWIPPTAEHPSVVEDVPRRDPVDYGPEGGGGTWYPV